MASDGSLLSPYGPAEPIRVLAVEIVTAARGIDLRAPLRPAPATGAVIATLRHDVAGAGPDRHLSPDLEAVTALVRDGTLLDAARTTRTGGSS
ncbi:MAG: hypothetical protein ABW075_11475 [Aeromicrobium sp.]